MFDINSTAIKEKVWKRSYVINKAMRYEGRLWSLIKIQLNVMKAAVGPLSACYIEQEEEKK